TKCCRSASAAFARTSKRWPTLGFSWTVTTKVICSRFSLNLSPTGRRYFSKSFSAVARRASAKVTSRRCSRQSRESKQCAERYRSDSTRTEINSESDTKMNAITTGITTTEDLLKLRPNKRFDRWLFRGELREKKLTKRNPHHSGAVAMIAYLLISWLKTRPKPRGRVYSNEVYFRIRKNPDTNVGIDVAVASPKQ